MPKESNAELLNKLKIADIDEEPDSSGVSKLWIIAASSVVIIALCSWYFLLPPNDVDDSIEAISSNVRITEPSRSLAQVEPPKSVLIDSNAEILNASGYVTARVRATVSAEILGKINSVFVEEGMYVEKGQVLAEIDSTIARVEWNLAKAQVSAIEQRIDGLKVELNEAERVLARLSTLDQKQFTSESALTRAEANVMSLNAEVKALSADLRVAKLAVKRQEKWLEKHTLRAPFSGVVTVKNAQPGEIISPSSAGGGFTRTGICTVVDMNSLEIEVDVNEAYIGRVFQNQKVVVILDAYPDWDVPARVIAVIPTADRAKATVRVRIALLEKDSKILPDMGVKVAFFEEAITEDDVND